MSAPSSSRTFELLRSTSPPGVALRPSPSAPLTRSKLAQPLASIATLAPWTHARHRPAPSNHHIVGFKLLHGAPPFDLVFGPCLGPPPSAPLTSSKLAQLMVPCATPTVSDPRVPPHASPSTTSSSSSSCVAPSGLRIRRLLQVLNLSGWRPPAPHQPPRTRACPRHAPSDHNVFGFKLLLGLGPLAPPAGYLACSGYGPRRVQ